MHFEVANDLTSGAFLAAFKRFIERRGKTSVIYLFILLMAEILLMPKKNSKQLSKFYFEIKVKRNLKLIYKMKVLLEF